MLNPHVYSYNYVPYTPTLKNRVPEILRKKSFGLREKKVQNRKVLSTQDFYTNLKPLLRVPIPIFLDSLKICSYTRRHLHHTKESAVCVSMLQD